MLTLNFYSDEWSVECEATAISEARSLQFFHKSVTVYENGGGTYWVPRLSKGV